MEQGGSSAPRLNTPRGAHEARCAARDPRPPERAAPQRACRARYAARHAPGSRATTVATAARSQD